MLSYSAQQSTEQDREPLPVVVPIVVVENEAVEVRREMLLRNDLVGAADAPLHVPPEALQPVDVRLTAHEFFFPVVDSVPLVTPRHQVIAVALVGKETGVFGVNVFLQELPGGQRFGVRGHLRPQDALALYGSGDDGLGLYRCAQILVVLARLLPATEIGVIHLHVALQKAGALPQGSPDAGEHPPGRLVGDVQVSLQLLCGVAALGV